MQAVEFRGSFLRVRDWESNGTLSPVEASFFAELLTTEGPTTNGSTPKQVPSENPVLLSGCDAPIQAAGPLNWTVQVSESSLLTARTHWGGTVYMIPSSRCSVG